MPNCTVLEYESEILIKRMINYVQTYYNRGFCHIILKQVKINKTTRKQYCTQKHVSMLKQQ